MLPGDVFITPFSVPETTRYWMTKTESWNEFVNIYFITHALCASIYLRSDNQATVLHISKDIFSVIQEKTDQFFFALSFFGIQVTILSRIA